VFSIDLTPISIFFLCFALTYLIGLVCVAVLERRRVHEEGEAVEHVFSLIVPARNEESVIEGCLRSLLALDYPADRVEIVVVDDGSTDATSGIAAGFAAGVTGRVEMLCIPAKSAGRGKPSALNHAFAHLQKTGRFRTNKDWVIGIFDADGHPDPDMLKKASFQFRSASVAGVQATVRIRNRGHSWLTRMQDIEFAGFSRVTQLIRMRITNSASLGGNGQFVRATALEAVALNQAEGIYWNPDVLVEDLDLSAKLALRDWDLHHLNTSQVWQEGVEGFLPLIRQRTRWAWGSLQVFTEYVLGLKILTAPNVRLRKRIDLFLNLSIFLVSPLVLVSWIVAGFTLVHLVNAFSSFPPAIMVLLSFGYLPLVGYGVAGIKGYRKNRLPLDLIGFAIYTYHWVPCLYAGLWHLLRRHGTVWWKTARGEETPVS
jgi:cellulose synthase/poly-beta-1,6-N-acetylglucosamine synthase-like glycosyltransferase